MSDNKQGTVRLGIALNPANDKNTTRAIKNKTRCTAANLSPSLGSGVKGFLAKLRKRFAHGRWIIKPKIIVCTAIICIATNFMTNRPFIFS